MTLAWVRRPTCEARPAAWKAAPSTYTPPWKYRTTWRGSIPSSVPFRMALQQGGAKAVMASYNAWNGVPMAINPILKSILINQWHADVVSSDGGAVGFLVTQHHAFPTQKQAVVGS